MEPIAPDEVVSERRGKGWPVILARLKKLYHLAGFLIMAACFGFVGYQIVTHRLWETAHLPWRLSLALLGVGALVYVGSCFCLSLAWRRSVAFLSDHPLPGWPVHAVYGRTWLARFLPGKMFHFAGRQVLGSRIGLGQAEMAAASFFEVSGQFWAGAVFMVWGLAVYGLSFSALSLPLFAALLLTVPAAWVVLNRLSQHRWLKTRVNLPARKTMRFVQGVWPLSVFYLLYFLVQGLMAWGLIAIATGSQDKLSFGRAVTIQAGAWLAGFVTPGAPSGLGVREAVLMLGLKPYLGEPMSLWVALMLRLMALIGDVVFFLIFLVPLRRSGTAKAGPTSSPVPDS